jgi:hypothetical protein
MILLAIDISPTRPACYLTTCQFGGYKFTGRRQGFRCVGLLQTEPKLHLAL